jgi:competence ComEA-like helix-hairpin-helix protein
MQQKPLIHKLCYFNNWLLSAKLLSLLIIIYGALLFVSCQQNTKTPVLTVQKQSHSTDSAVNINTAGAEELEKVPRIGRETARRIIEHRIKYGAFRRVENLMLVQGMSDKKFREIRSYIKVE